MQNLLVISAIAPNRKGMANEITELVTYCGCNILESKMKSMGNTFSLVLMATGEWNALAKLEHVLPSKAHSMGMTTMLQRSEARPPQEKHLPYRVKFFASDNQGIANKITKFFTEQQVNIEQLSCDTFTSKQTGASVAEIKLTVSIPGTVAIAKLREAFSHFCEQQNLDASFTPITQ
ncbi:MAG: ACT domain-containing protein [Kangiellaceae bacterium]|jgi:glycine cleavage system transcriptional repressor